MSYFVVRCLVPNYEDYERIIESNAVQFVPPLYELIVSAAEEANIVYEYRQTGDTEILYNYCIKALLPHMVYYCAHSLHLGRDRSLTCSRQAVGLILTKIVGGRPVTNITFTCKRMLRTYKNRGDFWYYDKAPEAVKLMVNRIDMSALADLYKVTKDRRI